MTDFIRVASLSELPERQPVRADCNGTAIALVRIGDQVHAVSDTCTHAEASFCDGGHVEGDFIVCPLHFASFRLTDGEAGDPPADDPLQVFEVKVDGDDVLVRS
ncbi:MAG: non-heme iron oxygenase ferredoxin subunit [Phycisphaerales bacterium]|nr:non-heme iron oxygenase ferredoxin subunit [Phycisphaerales bacterium]